MQRHLIIKSLHRDESFLAGAVNELEKHLVKHNACTVVRDLYAMNFNPVLTTNDFELLKQGMLPEDIKREQKYISEADIVWIVFPVWWTSMPAILKGYIDRIFLSGFAYTMKNDAPVGKLQGKKVMLVSSMGQSYEEYQELGMFDALKLTIDKGIFEFCGMDVIDHLFFSSIMSASDDLKSQYRSQLLDSANKLLLKLKPESTTSNKLNEFS